MKSNDIVTGNSLIIGKTCSGKTTAINNYIKELAKDNNMKIFSVNLYGENKSLLENLCANDVTTCAYNPYKMPNINGFMEQTQLNILNYKIDFLIRIHELVKGCKFTNGEKILLGRLLQIMYAKPHLNEQEIYDIVKQDVNFTKEAIENIRNAAIHIKNSQILCSSKHFYHDDIGKYNENNNLTALCIEKLKVFESELKIQKLCYLDFVYCQMLNYHYSNPETKSVLIIDDILNFIEGDKYIFDQLYLILKRCRMLNGFVVCTTSAADPFSAKEYEYLYNIINLCNNIEMFAVSKNEIKFLNDGFPDDKNLINKAAKLKMGEHISFINNCDER